MDHLSILICPFLSQNIGELFDLDAASLQLKVINYVSGISYSCTLTLLEKRNIFLCDSRRVYEINVSLLDYC